ncbi:MAG: arylsulfatase A [Pseudoalteromonas tetraodonis]|jgi:arylsulfatase A
MNSSSTKTVACWWAIVFNGDMRSLQTVALAILLSFGVARARNPNVIVIFTDDQGSVDAGCYGTEDIETPNIDLLAERGSRFTQFYAAAPVCSPSRAGLLTGRYPLRAGVPGNTTSEKGKPGMPTGQVTMAEHFKAAGYRTAHIGKWHLGYTPEDMPNAQGFDHSFGHMGGCIDNYSHFFYWQGPNRHDLYRNGEEIYADGKFFPDLMVNEACEFIKDNQADPFFIYFAMNMPHYPYQGDAHWLEHYKDVPHPRNLYNAFVSALDSRIGDLVRYLDEVGLREDTIIVFQSDHGHSTEGRAHFGGGSSGPYRGAKFSLFEGGIRVPAIISWPGKLPEKKTFDQLAHSCDWLPTLAELAEIELVHKDIDGLSLAPLLKGDTQESPHDLVHWQVGTGAKAQWAVLDGDWKLIGNVRDTSNPKSQGDPPAKLFLSNLKEDRSEKKNYAAKQPEIVRKLRAAHDAWLESTKGLSGNKSYKDAQEF